ncbi:MAG: Lrp/AsnC family transcriptional regulator [Nitrososphaeria archaeon]
MTQLKRPIQAKDKYQVDEVDKKVLRGYQQDASLSYKELSEIIGLPSSTIFDRVKRLRKAGIIKAIVPILDPEMLGLHTTAWITAKVEKGADCCETADRIAKIPGVLEVHEIVGLYDIFIKVKVCDNIDLHNISELISKTPGVQEAHSMVALRTVKEDVRLNI